MVQTGGMRSLNRGEYFSKFVDNHPGKVSLFEPFWEEFILWSIHAVCRELQKIDKIAMLNSENGTFPGRIWKYLP